MYKKEIKLTIMVWGIFLLGLLILGTLFTISRIKNDTAWTKAQIDNVGKPTVIDQYYHTK